jgi:hypothetical protein
MQQPSVPERRTSERIPMAVGVQAYAYGSMVASGMTVNMSETGVLLRIERDCSGDELEPGKHLDILLEDSRTWDWLPVKVVRRLGDYIAACFIGVEHAAC